MSIHHAVYHRGDRVPLRDLLAAVNRFRARRGVRALRALLLERFGAEGTSGIPREKWAAVIAALDEE